MVTCCSICREKLVFGPYGIPYELCGACYRYETPYTICGRCCQGARSIIALSNTNNPISDTGLSSAVKWVKEMKDDENEMIKYLSGFAAAFKDQILTDIQVLPGNSEPPIPAHRALLASRSRIFRNVLEGGECKGTITVAEMNHEQVEALVEFLYSGSLAKEKVEKHVCSLLIAADKYEIPFLQKFCERHLLGTLSSSNALDIFEISDTYTSNQNLKETCLNFILRNMEDIVFSAEFDALALKKPHLAVQITRASFKDTRKRKFN